MSGCRKAIPFPPPTRGSWICGLHVALCDACLPSGCCRFVSLPRECGYQRSMAWRCEEIRHGWRWTGALREPPGRNACKRQKIVRRCDDDTSPPARLSYVGRWTPMFAWAGGVPDCAKDEPT